MKMMDSIGRVLSVAFLIFSSIIFFLGWHHGDEGYQYALDFASHRMASSQHRLGDG